MIHIITAFLVITSYVLLGTNPVFAGPAPVPLGPEWGFGKITSLAQGTEKLMPFIFSIAGVALVFYFIYGAAKLVFSGGDKNNVAAARAMITHVIIGVILLIVLFLVMQFIPEFLGINLRVIQTPNNK